MKGMRILLLGLVGWTAIGLVGVGVSWRRGEREKVRHGMGWLAGVWVAYLFVVIAVSLVQRQSVVGLGQPRCFDEMCFRVIKVEEVPGFLIRDGRRLLRVSIQVTNHARKEQ